MNSTAEEIGEIITNMDANAGAMHKEIIDICFYMRGGINIDQAYQLSPQQRKFIFKRIKKNIEQTEKSGISLL